MLGCATTACAVDPANAGKRHVEARPPTVIGLGKVHEHDWNHVLHPLCLGLDLLNACLADVAGCAEGGSQTGARRRAGITQAALAAAGEANVTAPWMVVHCCTHVGTHHSGIIEREHAIRSRCAGR